MKKYKLTEETKTLEDGTVLHRIRAVKDFALRNDAKVREGDIGGWVEKEDNLSQIGEAWVFGEARVYGEARVCDRACVFGEARVCDDARVYGSARVSGEACVCGEAYVCGIHDYAVFKNTWGSGRWFTYTRSDKMWKVGCFRGTGDELIAKAYKDSELSGRCYETIVRAQEAIEAAKEGLAK